MPDEDHVYLEVEGTQFGAAYNRVMVPIPVHIWEVIRHYPNIDLKHADKTDAEFRQYVEQEVDDRLKLYREAGERAKGLCRFLARWLLAQQNNRASNRLLQE